MTSEVKCCKCVVRLPPSLAKESYLCDSLCGSHCQTEYPGSIGEHLDNLRVIHCVNIRGIKKDLIYTRQRGMQSGADSTAPPIKSIC